MKYFCTECSAFCELTAHEPAVSCPHCGKYWSLKPRRHLFWFVITHFTKNYNKKG